MQKEFKNVLNLIIAYAVVLLLFTLARVYFLSVLIPKIAIRNNLNLLEAFLYGFIYDIRFVFGINGIIILLFFFPIKLRNTIFWQFIVRTLFVFVNSILILIYVIDAKYYHFMNEHLKLLNSSNESVVKQLIYAVQSISLKLNNSWDIIFLAAIIFIGLWYIFPSINKIYFERTKANLYTRGTLSFIGLVLFWNMVTCLNNNSDTWQVKVFERMNKPSTVLAINSPYSILKFYMADQLVRERYFEQNDLESMFPVKKLYRGNNKIRKNVLLFNIDWTTDINEDIKNVIKQSGTNALLVDNFNVGGRLGLKQIDEMLLSIPAFSQTGIMKTTYAFNNLESLASILNKHRYRSVFIKNVSDYHYDKAITHFYGFDTLMTINNKDALFSMFTDELNISSQKQPVFVFYQIISNVRNLLSKLKEKNLLNNSLIIINIPKFVSDSDIAFGKTIFLMPERENISLMSNQIQNVDILPSVIDNLNIEEKFISFGESIFKKTGKQTVFQSTGNEYIIMADSLLLRYNGLSTKWLVDYKNDPDELFDLQDSLPVQKVQLEYKIRAIIQQYNNRLIDNRMILRD